ncbi:MAG: hypothetical protein COT14_00145 [Candidatus Diapherotrites archaeon CG08_land_8_20_14_0_20_30_16]|nr:MAG: hypothetical protein COT14_00145 [Candidatus Diapherotrites archaeon CG08_land_8_20_14_0_20_30_16]
MYKIVFSEAKAKAELKDFLKEIKKDKNIVAAYLFGSYITGRTKEESDVDICIIPIDEKYDVYKYNQDLVQASNFWKLPPNIQYHILFEGKLLYLPKKYDYKIHKLKFKTIGEYDFYKRLILNKRYEWIING